MTTTGWREADPPLTQDDAKTAALLRWMAVAGVAVALTVCAALFGGLKP